MKVDGSVSVKFAAKDEGSPVVMPKEGFAVVEDIKKWLAQNLQFTAGIEEIVITKMTIIVDVDGSVVRVDCETNSKSRKLRWFQEHPKKYDCRISV